MNQYIKPVTDYQILELWASFMETTSFDGVNLEDAIEEEFLF